MDSGLDAVSPLTGSARAVLWELAAHGPATRPQLGERLQFSRPTMSLAMADLTTLGLIETNGSQQRHTGRKAVTFQISTSAGHVAAIDAGSTHVRIRLCSLDGRVLYAGSIKLDTEQRRLSSEISAAVADILTEAKQATRSDWGDLRAIGVALPTRVQPNTDYREDPLLKPLFTHFKPPAAVPLILENNVNCAAIAEGTFGAAKGVADYAYLQIGLKVGMGVVLNGSVVRGRNGATGEIGSLPFPWAPGHRPTREKFEDYIGSEALMARVRSAWPADVPAPKSPQELYDLAQAGNAVAQASVEDHARDIGALAAAVVSVIDPGLVVIGGGIGQHAEVVPLIKAVSDDLSFPSDVVATALGTEGTLLGISRLTLEAALRLLVEPAKTAIA